MTYIILANSSNAKSACQIDKEYCSRTYLTEIASTDGLTLQSVNYLTSKQLQHYDSERYQSIDKLMQQHPELSTI
jgi:hypothetical protein